MNKCVMVIAILGWVATGVWAGDITGQVTLGSSPTSRKVGEKRGNLTYGEKGDVPSPTETEVEDVVVYLEGPNLPCTVLSKMTPQNTVLQKNKEFLPHVMPIVKGSNIYFRNQDPFPHHVYSVSGPCNFEIAKHTAVRSQEFGKSGEVEVFCGIHTKMNAYVLVLENDCFGVPNRDGKYRIRSVPAGQYALMVWHPRLPKPEKRMITVPASGSLTLDLKL